MRQTRKPAHLMFEESPAQRIDSILAALDDADSVAALDDETVGLLHAELLDLFDGIRSGEVEGIDRADVDTLRRVAEGATNLAALAAVRETEAAERDAAIAELEAQLRPAAVEDEADKVEADDADTVVAVEAGEDTTPTADTDDTAEADEVAPEPVAAAAPARPAAAAVARRTPAQARRTPAAPQSRVQVLANGVATDRAGLVAALTERVNATRGPVNHFDKTTVGRVLGYYPDDLRLTGVDPDHDAQVIEAVTAATRSVEFWRNAEADGLVAAGQGWCAPASIEYERPHIGATSRPVRDSLAPFQAPRGSVRLAAPLKLTAIDVSGSDAAVSKWTQANDQAGTSKPIQVINCADFTTYEMYAVTKRLRFGNFGQRAYPENVNAWLDMADVAHARLGEVLLLDALKGLCDYDVQTPTSYGAARDLADAMIRAAIGIRNRHRAPDTALRVWAPWWVVALGATDLIMGGDAREGYAEAEATFRSWLGGAGVNLSLFIDNPTGTTTFTAAEVDGTLLDGWPTSVGWAIADEGHFLFLDGGSQDFGVVRDSELNDTNEAEVFAETFEGIAKRGVEAMWVNSNVCVDGTYAGGVVDAVTCAS